MAGMVVQHNMNALNAYNKLNTNVSGLKKSSEKLSSGYRINRAGDDAAGLAISEKMRSQIRGLSQAKRNSQDGISMIQTFEGAAQETHSILQRMKELAAESANGTYDNATDRAAIQLEFDQLNDELNQIADTDFNGTIVLNGGQMSDGLKQVNGEFNYATAERDSKQLSKTDINLLDAQNFDNKGTLKTIADDVWKEISNEAWDRSKSTNNQGPDSVDVTLQYDKTKNEWTVTGATNGADSDKLEAKATDNGGFELKTKAGLKIANVIVDETSLKNGDSITLTLNNPASGVAAPTNAGATQTAQANWAQNGDTKDAKDYDVTVAIDGYVTDDTMTPAIKSILDAIDGAQLDVTYASTKALADKATTMKLTLSDGTSVTGILGDGSTNSGILAAGSTITLKDGTQFQAKINNGAIEIYDNKDGDNLIATITPGAHAATEKTSGTLSYKLGMEYKNYDTSKLPTVEVKSPDSSAVSNSNSFKNSTARMTYSDHLVLQTGARTKDSVDFTFQYNTDGSADMGTLKANLNISARADGLNTENLSLATQDDANYAIDQIDKAINKVSMVRASFGSIQNRLEHKIENLTTTTENLTEAESTIRDTDMASEMLNYTKYNILQQAAQSMLAQANQQPQSVLQLLG